MDHPRRVGVRRRPHARRDARTSPSSTSLRRRSGLVSLDHAATIASIRARSCRSAFVVASLVLPDRLAHYITLRLCEAGCRSPQALDRLLIQGERHFYHTCHTTISTHIWRSRPPALRPPGNLSQLYLAGNCRGPRSAARSSSKGGLTHDPTGNPADRPPAPGRRGAARRRGGGRHLRARRLLPSRPPRPAPRRPEAVGEATVGFAAFPDSESSRARRWRATLCPLGSFPGRGRLMGGHAADNRRLDLPSQGFRGTRRPHDRRTRYYDLDTLCVQSEHHRGVRPPPRIAGPREATSGRRRSRRSTDPPPTRSRGGSRHPLGQTSLPRREARDGKGSSRSRFGTVMIQAGGRMVLEVKPRRPGGCRSAVVCCRPLP